MKDRWQFYCKKSDFSKTNKVNAKRLWMSKRKESKNYKYKNK